MKKTLKRLSNYIMYEYEQDGMEYVGISTVMGDWNLEYRSDNPMYLQLRLISDKDDAFLEFCTLMFVTTYTLHGAEVYGAIRDSIIKEVESVGKPDVSKEDDEKMLDDTINMVELGEKMREYGEVQD